MCMCVCFHSELYLLAYVFDYIEKMLMFALEQCLKEFSSDKILKN